MINIAETSVTLQLDTCVDGFDRERGRVRVHLNLHHPNEADFMAAQTDSLMMAATYAHTHRNK